MDDRTLEALKASIVKWEKNASVENIEDALLGAGECPLCMIFNPTHREVDATTNRCDGCPVMAKTGEVFCQGTPYDEVEFFADRDDLGDFIRASKRELDFLRSLLPEQEA